MNIDQAVEALRETPATPGNLTPRTFSEQGQQSAATSDAEEEIATLKAPAPLVVRTGQRFEVSLPAYEQFSTNGTAGDTETFNLSHSIVDTPNTENLVLWEAGTYIGAEGAVDAIDYDANTFDYTDDGTNTTLHVWYISEASADLTVRKVTSSENSQQGLYDGNLRLVHNTNLSEQPETPDANRTKLNRVIATDMEVEVLLDAPYTFRWEDPDGDGAEPTNLLFSFPVNRAKRDIPGLEDPVSVDMSNE
jgi:hypothetical protein